MWWWPGVSLWGVLWLWGPLARGHPLRLEKVRADTRNLTRTLSTRLQQLQILPLSLKLSGLEALAGGGGAPPEGLVAMDQHLQGLQRLLAGLAAGNLPLAQIANDLENLRSLLGAWAAHLGCASPPPDRRGGEQVSPPPPALELVAEAPHSVAGLALARLRQCLEGVAARLEGTPGC
ncbi:leptin [Athene noctua]|uniref:leptin n=1 Tax=Athene noctua TaxID=126797 RepID=UPI003EBDA806